MERRSLSKLPIWFKNLGESSRPLPYGSDVPARHCRACIAATARFVVACYIYGQPAVLWWLRRARAKRQAAANAALLSAVHAKKRRARRSVVVLSALLDALGVDSGVAGSKVKRVRRKYVRASDEWKGSTLFGYLYNQETDDAKEAIYKQKFRMTVKMFDSIASQLSASSCTFVPRHGFIKRKISKLKPVSFKLGACLYVLALGACIGSAADTASIGKSTLELWLRQFATACCTCLRSPYHLHCCSKCAPSSLPAAACQMLPWPAMALTCRSALITITTGIIRDGTPFWLSHLSIPFIYLWTRASGTQGALGITPCSAHAICSVRFWCGGPGGLAWSRRGHPR